MSDFSIEQMTLRQKCTAAERLVSELVEHLERGFIPKAHALRKLVRQRESDLDEELVGDVTVRTQAAQVLESERFTRDLYGKAENLFTAIQQELEAIVKTR